MPLLLRVQRLLCVAERVRGLLCAPILVGGLLLRVAVRRRLCVALPHGGPHGQSRPHQCCLGEIHKQFPPLPPLPAPADPPSISILEPSLAGPSTSAPNARYEYMSGLMCYVCTVTVLNLLCQSRRSRQLVCSSLDFLCFPALPDGPSFQTDQPFQTDQVSSFQTDQTASRSLQQQDRRGTKCCFSTEFQSISKWVCFSPLTRIRKFLVPISDEIHI
eukprot:COSAG02_NODE_1550_length_11965_cov_326.834401_4_plen_217_part_00